MTAGKRQDRITDKTRARIIDLARDGHSTRAIAAKVSVSASTVSKVCRNAEPPITFDRARTKAATQARVEDAKAHRTRIARGLLTDADTIRTQLFEQRTRVHYSVTGGRQEYTAPPTPSELRELAVAFGVLLDKHLALARFDSDDRDLPAVDRWIARMLGEDE